MKPGIGLIAKKVGMTQVFREDGRPVPVTVLEAGPCTVLRAKTVETDGYRAVQLGFGKSILKEFRLPADSEFAVGSSVTVEQLFKPGDRIDVTGRSIGKGFQGGVKRWHWKGGPATHGSMSHRAPGSIGSSTNPSRVFRGHHLPGHMGDRRVTTQALEVVRVEAAQHLLLVKGAVPGSDRGIVLIRKSRKPPRVPVVQRPQAKKKAAPQQVAKPAAPAKEKKGK